MRGYVLKEQSIVDDIVEYVRARGGWVRKIHGDQYHAGIPDLVICYNGAFISVECKSATGAKRPAQAVEMSKIIKAGGRAIVGRHMDDIIALLKEIDSL